MSDDNVTLSIILDNTEAVAAIDQTSQKVDEVTSRWAAARKQIESEIRNTGRLISSLITSLRQAITLFGGTIDPWFDALFAALSSTISTLLAIGVAFAAGIVTTPLAAVIFGVAGGLSVVATGKLYVDLANITAKYAAMDARIMDIQRQQQSLMGVSF